MMTTYIRPGGLARRAVEFEKAVRDFLKIIPVASTSMNRY